MTPVVLNGETLRAADVRGVALGRPARLDPAVTARGALCEAGIEPLTRSLRSSRPLEAAVAAVRRVVPALDEDRPPAPDIEAILRLMSEGTILERVSQTLPMGDGR